MGVFTPVAAASLRALLARYDLGELQDFAGIADGVENTNYLVRTDRTELVLTLIERLTAPRLHPIFRLLERLAAAGLPVPRPLADREGLLLHTLHGRPALLAARLPGCSIRTPGPAECASIGHALGRMHGTLQGIALHGNHRGPGWWRRTAAALATRLEPAAQELLRSELEHQYRFRTAVLPRGPVHGDLFRDNVLFDGPHIGGLLDFYAAAEDVLLFDVAIAVNDWCRTGDAGLDPGRTCALLTAYHMERPFTLEEGQLWPVLLRSAALRFWLSRLQAPAPGKDPEEFELLLRHHRANAPQLRDLWRQAGPAAGAPLDPACYASGWC